MKAFSVAFLGSHSPQLSLPHLLLLNLISFSSVLSSSDTGSLDTKEELICEANVITITLQKPTRKTDLEVEISTFIFWKN
jgi:hypothetical protein